MQRRLDFTKVRTPNEAKTHGVYGTPRSQDAGMPCERDFVDGLTQIETAKTHGVATESGCKTTIARPWRGRRETTPTWGWAGHTAATSNVFGSGYRDTEKIQKGSGQIEIQQVGSVTRAQVKSGACRSCRVGQTVGGRRRSSIGCVSSTTSGGDATHRHTSYTVRSRVFSAKIA